MLNNKWLHTFYVLVEVGHFTKTAKKLFMTQPGVSQHIGKLEAQLDVALINRIGKSFELTEAGKTLYEFVKQQKQQEQILKTNIKEDSEHKGMCTLACSGAVVTQIYPHLLSRQAQYLELSIHIQADSNQGIIDKIISNKIDLGVVSQQFAASELHFEKIANQPFCLILPASYKNKKVSFNDLLSLGFINHPDGHQYAERLLSANFKGEFKSISEIKQSGFVNQLNQILLPVAFGLGFTVLPEFAVKQFNEPNKLYTLPLNNSISDDLYLVHKANKDLPKRYNWLKLNIGKFLTVS
ncbi:LysR family transcriptional regulator [Thalassomonas sp. M1454]|uniref:LysR family transcriptional regulator n=1 Tax=Thalassomonas sp. M1454 TaxID=2594477 RepID=UPI00117D1E73|nr:LysR family transcriptional regulator [Thalassomonas sp. M1454]TRX56550.1 LysR family transcriptional regulator [Thalassomonas sp. M1454]